MAHLKSVPRGPMTHRDRIQRMLEKTDKKDFQGNKWGARHVRSWLQPAGKIHPIVSMIEAWADYGDAHLAQYESTIGEDYVLGDEWETIGRAILGLLNGELGGLDGGTVDSLVREMLEAEGFDADVGGRKKEG